MSRKFECDHRGDVGKGVALYALGECHQMDYRQLREGRKGLETFDDSTEDARSSKLKDERVV